MIDLSKYKTVYFVGIGGIGMSAQARYFHSQGKLVKGYDRQRTKLTNQLESEGIEITYVNDEKEVAAQYDTDTTLVVYTAAIKEDHPVLSYFLKNGFDTYKRAKILHAISADSTTLAVAGTHGKTTTASILAHLLASSAVGCNAFLGGIMTNYDSNVILNPKSKIAVVEADEYDRSFLQLKPASAIITSMDPDHLDIYGNADDFEKSFIEFAQLVDEQGYIVCHEQVDIAASDLRGKVLKYGFGEGVDIRAFNVRVDSGRFIFDLDFNGEQHQNLVSNLPGRHNLNNTIAAITQAHLHGSSWEEIRKGLETFQGVYRRFQVHFRSENRFYIDDYAHHPTEIEAVYQAGREMFPGKKLTCVFQPHLFSRTKDFLDGFAKSLSKFDEIILLDIYPARELPMPGITSQLLLDTMESANKSLFTKETILSHITGKELEVLFTLGAGDIDTLVDPISEHFRLKYSTVKH